MKGFTLIEVLVALVVLQVALVGVLGTALAATRTMHAAEATSLRARAAMSVLDSLRAAGPPRPGSSTHGPVAVSWTVDSIGAVDLAAITPDSVEFRLHTVLRIR